MVFPLGHTLANVFLCYHEKIWLQKCPSECKPVIYRRYVDDTFLLFRSKHPIEKLWLQKCPSEYKSVIYRRYVDDTFLLFRSKHHIEKLRNYLNCNVISFTYSLNNK